MIKHKPTVTLTLKAGTPSPAQKQAWKRFWKKLLNEVKASE